MFFHTLIQQCRKNDRPEFVKQKYPQDLAYNFKEGDLRGMYAVFIPELTKALQENSPREDSVSE